MDSDLRNKLIDILNGDDFKNQINLLTLEEKINIISSYDYIGELVMEECSNKGIKLFINEEIVKYWQDDLGVVIRSLWKFTNDNFFWFNINREKFLMNICDVPDSYLKQYYFDFNDLFVLQYIKDDNIIMELINNYLTIDESLTLLCRLFIRRNIDNIIEDMLNNKKYKSIYGELLTLFNDESKIIQYLDRLSKYDKSGVVAKIKDEKIKKEALNSLKFGKGEVIASLKSDKEKEEYLKKIKRQFYINRNDKMEDIAIIVASFDDFNYMKKYVNYLNNEKMKYNYLKKISMVNSMKNGELALFDELILSINNEKYICDLLCDYILVHKRLSTNLNMDLTKKLIDKINNQDLLVGAYFYEEVQELILKKLDQKHINKIVRENMGYLDNYNILKYIEDDALFFEAIAHYNYDSKYIDDMLPIFERFSKRYNLNLEHLIALAKISNCNILNYYNDNIMKTVNLDDESFEKYISIFANKNNKMDKSTLSTILTSILQRKFSITEEELVNIFADTLHNVEDNNISDAMNKINKVCESLNIDDYGISKDTLINGLLAKDENVIKVFNKMTNDYLRLERNIYVDNHMNEIINMVTKASFEKKSLINFLIKVTPVDIILSDLDKSQNYINNYDDVFTTEEKELLEDNELLKKIIKFKKNLIDAKELDIRTKQKLKVFNDLYFKYNVIKYSDCLKAPFSKDVTIERSLYEENKEFLACLIANINTDKMEKLVFDNPKLYQELLKYLDKYKITCMNDVFAKAFEMADVDFDASLLGSLISNFELIMKTKKEEMDKGNNFGFMDELKFADVLNSDAGIYSILLGKDNYRFIKGNPGPNSSSMNKKDRLNRAIELLKEMHKRKYITVPPIDENIKLKSNKDINILLGDTSSLMNLTFGERTGACMRIGGAGSSLFDFCLLNENGFHISFNHPTTGKLISRISGFRNGNTIFLNQLRTSLDNEYTNEDLIEACKIIGKKIIEKTKDSKYPIVNVVASDGYVFSGSKTIDLGINNCKKGFPYFYTDVNRDAVVVATANNDELLPIKLGPNNSEKYEVMRKKPIKYYNRDAIENMLHLEVLDKFYSNIDITDIDLNKRDDVLFAYVSEDWYVAVLDNYEIISYVSNNSNNIELANEEMNKYFNTIRKEINSLKKFNSDSSYKKRSINNYTDDVIYNDEVRVVRK